MTSLELWDAILDDWSMGTFALKHPLVTTEHLDNGVFWDLYELLDTYYE